MSDNHSHKAGGGACPTESTGGGACPSDPTGGGACPTALHFGAGNIGRGFLGQLYYESGFHTRFVDVDQPTIDALNARHAYPLHLVDEANIEKLLIEHVDAVHGNDLTALGDAFAQAAIVSTAVGGPVLRHIAPAIAHGIQRRLAAGGNPVDIIVCENLADAGHELKLMVRAHLPVECHEYLETSIGFVDASIGRMVPVMTAAQRAEDPLLVCVEPYCELPVDAEAFRAAIPPIKHLLPKPGFKAYVARKLYVHNMSHAATAYWGHAKGYTLIADAIRDAEIQRWVLDAAWESCRALAGHFQMDIDELDAHRMDLVRRYHNRALGDQISRVARDPIRKLGPKDRLIGAGLLCVVEKVPPVFIAKAVAAAIRYTAEDDPASLEIHRILEERGLEGVLREVCHLEPTAHLAHMIREHFEDLTPARHS